MEERIVTRRWFLRTAMMGTAVAAAGLTVAETIEPAAAMPVAPPADPLVPEEDGNIHLAQTAEQRRRRRRRRNRAERRRWRYSARRHGRRYRRRRRGYTYYYGGWYYPRPWWTFGPGIIIDL